MGRFVWIIIWDSILLGRSLETNIPSPT
uniref:Uncharacterized protein n=1 Tax=Arundo donax TaxID=35708 RepID=A0A0A9HJG3_ARUDO